MTRWSRSTRKRLARAVGVVAIGLAFASIVVNGPGEAPLVMGLLIAFGAFAVRYGRLVP